MNEFAITTHHLVSTIVLVIVVVSSLIIYWLLKRCNTAEYTLSRLRVKLDEYSTIVNVEAKAESIVCEAHLQAEAILRETSEAEDRLRSISRDIKCDQEQLDVMRESIDHGRAELGLHSAIREMQEYGIFEPRFKFDHSDEFKSRVKCCIDQQRSMVKSKEACVCGMHWEVNGNRRVGTTMTTRNIQLTLRAFNGECTGVIASVTYRSFESCVNKLRKSHEAINRLGETNAIEITLQYLQLKLEELRLHYEWARMKQDEKELEREHRELLREETLVQKEAQTEIRHAERDESRLIRELESARQQCESLAGEQANRLEKLINDLEKRLAEALDRKAKAVARAQLTRSGFVYVLSNIGTFGEGVFKIGLTRRLDPQERVRELASASVPFPFDVHAMIYSEDAPALERSLHKRFDAFRVNLVNGRKEYFRAELDDIAKAVGELYGSVTFMNEAVAAEYRETVAKRRFESQDIEQRRCPLGIVQGEGSKAAAEAPSHTEQQTIFPSFALPIDTVLSSPAEIV